NHHDAVHYFFDAAQLGGRGHKVIVDGTATKLDEDYLAGPVRVAQLGDGSGHEIITLAAFLKALPVGDHTVRIVGQLAGELIQADLNLAFYGFDFTYKVKVVR